MSRIVAALAIASLAFPAQAHHPLAGMPMETLMHGILSGIGHPLIGFDHLFFILMVGFAAALTRHRLLAPAAYIAAMLAGCLVSSLGLALPASEPMIALSLLVLGGLLLAGRGFRLSTALALFAGFGLFHGSAFGDTLAAQESGYAIQVLIGYLSGLGITQYAMAIAAGRIGRHICKNIDAAAIEPRLAGAMAAGVGLFLTLESIEVAVLGALIG